MTKNIVNEADMDDPILKNLADAVIPVSDSMYQSEDHAIFCIGVKYTEEGPGGEGPGVQTFFSATGFNGVIAEGLYQELADMIADGQMGLFAALRDVIRDLEEDFDISPDEELDDEPSTLH